MHSRLICFTIILVFCQSLYAAGPACFNYETYEHQGGAAPGANRALVTYDHAQIAARDAAIPPLAPGAYQMGVSKRRWLGVAPTAWEHNVFVLAGGPLNYQEACLMVLERQGIGITVNFQHPNIINAIAAGFPLPVVAAFFGMGVPALTQYLNHALGGGGYRSTLLATALYRLRHNVPPNFIILAVGGNADTVLVHIHEPRRVSKNGKELSYNSIPNMAAYFSIKDIIDAPFNGLGIATPDSSTVLSANLLQLN